MKKTAALVLAFLLIGGQVFAWGPKGHALIGDIAATRLTPQTRANVRLLLGDQSLAAIASWADDVRKDHPEAYGWHFVDIPKDAAGFSQARDCYTPDEKHAYTLTDHHNCVVDRIEMFTRVLTDPKASRTQRVEALKWVVHFVGDIHQPLHDIDTARGGNDIKLPAFGDPQCGNYPCNLHWVWDGMLIEHTGRSEADYLPRLLALIKAEGLEKKADGTPEDWANESHLQARQIINQGPTAVDQAYYEAHIHLVDQKLALAGLRLASLLNHSLGKIPTQQLDEELKNHQP